jgi:hypothetical protein
MSSKTVFGSVLVVSSLLLANAGYAEQAVPVHKGPWPIRSGYNYQPSERELRSLHLQDVTPEEARVIDRLYGQLLAKNPATHKQVVRQKGSWHRVEMVKKLGQQLSDFDHLSGSFKG